MLYHRRLPIPFCLLLFAACSFSQAGDERPNAEKRSEGDLAITWMSHLASRKVTKAAEMCSVPFLFAERDARLDSDGKPIRPHYWGGQVLKTNAQLSKFLERMTGRDNLFKVESIEAISAKRAAKQNAGFSHVLPNGGYRITAAQTRQSDAIELYVNKAGKIVALVGVER